MIRLSFKPITKTLWSFIRKVFGQFLASVICPKQKEKKTWCQVKSDERQMIICRKLSHRIKTDTHSFIDSKWNGDVKERTCEYVRYCTYTHARIWKYSNCHSLEVDWDQSARWLCCIGAFIARYCYQSWWLSVCLSVKIFSFFNSLQLGL